MAFITNFQAPKDISDLEYFLLDNNGYTYIDYFDGTFDRLEWSVDPKAQEGDTVYFMCAKTSVDHMKRVVKAAQQSNDNGLLQFAKLELEKYQHFAGCIIATGIVDEEPYQTGPNTATAEVRDVVVLEKPIHIDGFRSFIKVSRTGAITKLTYSQTQRLEELIQANNQFVFFWLPDEENGYLSQWYQAKMIIDGVEYANCEQYMMAKKALAMGDIEYYGEIMKETDPQTIKNLGRAIRGFDSEKWNQCKNKIIYDGNYAKFSQNDELKDRLIATGDAILAEASQYDLIYGIGYFAHEPEARQPEKWKGESLLGKTLMRIRDELK